MSTLLSCLFGGMTRQRNRRVIRSIDVAIALLCSAAVQCSAQVIFTDWTSITNDSSFQGTAIGHLGPVRVTLGTFFQTDPAIQDSVLDGSSPVFNDSVFTPALPQSDYLALVADPIPDSIYTITFSSPVRDPVFHLSSVFHLVGFPGQIVSRLSGDAGFSVHGDTVLGGWDPGGPDFQGDGTVQLHGTITNIQLYALFRATDLDIFRMQMGAIPLPVLSMVRSDETLTLRWPVFATNFVLEATTNLSPPIAWAEVTNSTQAVGESFSVTVDPGLHRRFFRLRSTE
ncbi:MAG TPA: hypothetical protein VFT34_07610 [Verrucomicrobiae bacterium]|nr:hypothetical protein [Verrucomicrobiae bacterium]